MYAPCEIAAPLTDEPEAPFALIPLRNRVGQLVAFVLIDAEDEPRLGGFKWHLRNKGYVGRNIRHPDGTKRWDGRHRRTNLPLHRAVLSLAFGDPREVDHENHNKLDCRKANLRVVSHAANVTNRRAAGNRGSSSRFRGVSWHAGIGKWRAAACLNRKTYHLGCFEDEEEAGRVVAEWRREHMPYSTT